MPKAPDQHSRVTIGKAHQIKARRHAPRERRGSAASRGYGWQWGQFSKAFRVQNPLCEYCLANGITKASQVTDHDIPHHGDPELLWNNTFTALCWSCHSGIKQSMEARYSGDDLLEQIARRKGRGYSDP